MAKNPDSSKKSGKTPKSKAHRPEVLPIGPALAELLNPAINRGEAGLGSSTGLQPPPDNSWDRRAGGEAAAHRARKSTPKEFPKSAADPYPMPLRPNPQPAGGRQAPPPTLPRKRERAARGQHHRPAEKPIPRSRHLRPISRLRGPRRAKLALEAGVGASPNPRSANSRRRITAPPRRFRRSIPNWQSNSASPRKRKTPPPWRGRRATRWRRSASPRRRMRWTR